MSVAQYEVHTIRNHNTSQSLMMNKQVIYDKNEVIRILMSDPMNVNRYKMNYLIKLTPNDFHDCITPCYMNAPTGRHVMIYNPYGDDWGFSIAVYDGPVLVKDHYSEPICRITMFNKCFEPQANEFRIYEDAHRVLMSSIWCFVDPNHLMRYLNEKNSNPLDLMKNMILCNPCVIQTNPINVKIHASFLTVENFVLLDVVAPSNIWVFYKHQGWVRMGLLLCMNEEGNGILKLHYFEEPGGDVKPRPVLITIRADFGELYIHRSMIPKIRAFPPIKVALNKNALMELAEVAMKERDKN